MIVPMQMPRPSQLDGRVRNRFHSATKLLVAENDDHDASFTVMEDNTPHKNDSDTQYVVPVHFFGGRNTLRDVHTFSAIETPIRLRPVRLVTEVQRSDDALNIIEDEDGISMKAYVCVGTTHCDYTKVYIYNVYEYTPTIQSAYLSFVQEPVHMKINVSSAIRPKNLFTYQLVEEKSQHLSMKRFIGGMR